MKALILVDIQNDFLPGGALAVPDGDVVIPVVNKLEAAFPLVAATQDWHPANHDSFAANHPGKMVFEQIVLNGLPQTLWPVHCVQGTSGAELAPGLQRERIAKIFPKGTDSGLDSYSGLFDNGNANPRGWVNGLRLPVSRKFLCAAWPRITASNILHWTRHNWVSEQISSRTPAGESIFSPTIRALPSRK